MLLKEFKMTKLIINGQEFYCDHVVEVIPPSDISPWWQIVFDNGDQIWTSGNVVIRLEKREK
ncbi:MAG: hypothetical protein DRP01_04285 [Archaeoglobales archaeon]|nr:MAG: hypothetical protein DRP01_04285 [Archaeoglobales archaeon]